jgi:hypothetical protein
MGDAYMDDTPWEQVSHGREESAHARRRRSNTPRRPIPTVTLPLTSTLSVSKRWSRARRRVAAGSCVRAWTLSRSRPQCGTPSSSSTSRQRSVERSGCLGACSVR